jgi:hypothetical protein
MLNIRYLQGITLLSTWIFSQAVALAQPNLPNNSTTETNAVIQEQPSSELESLQGQVTSVNQLTDIGSTDWAFQALQTLVERYGCLTGYPDGTLRGNQVLSRYEFAAGLNACLDLINEQFISSRNTLAQPEDVEILHRLQAEFAAELTTLRGRVDRLETRTTTLEQQQFSTTTQLRGSIVMAVNAGGYAGDRIIDINGNEITDSQPNTTALYRASLFLDTSFTGTDLLRVLIEAGSDGISDNTGGFLEPVLGSVLDYSAKPGASNDRFGLSRVFYSFKPTEDLEVSVGPNVRITDYVDRNGYANVSVRDFNTLAFVNNYVLLPVSGPAAGAAIRWKPANTVSLNAAYVAAEAQNSSDQGVVRGVSAISRILYPNSCGESGLFGDTYQGIVEVEYFPSETFALRLQYTGGQVLDNGFHAIGANLEWTLSPQLGMFGRYGYSWYDNTAFGDLTPQYWMAGITIKDLLKEGALAGLAAGQPFVENRVGSGTQTNFEAFYSFPVNDNIRVSPAMQVITNSSNQDENGTIVTGTLRTVFSF